MKALAVNVKCQCKVASVITAIDPHFIETDAIKKINSVHYFFSSQTKAFKKLYESDYEVNHLL